MSKHAYIAPKRLSENIISSQIINMAETKQGDVYQYKKEGKYTYTGYINLFLKIKSYENIYIRDAIDFFFIRILTFFIGKSKLTYDFRAVVSEELIYKNRGYFKVRIFRFLEAFCYYTADELRTVSKNQKYYLKEYYKKNREVKVVPCGISDVIQRENYFINEKDTIKICYVGGLSSWQKFDEVCALFCKLIGNNKNIHLEVVTKEKSQAEVILRKYKLSNYVKVVSLQQGEVSNYISKFDYGVIFRDDSIINKVSCPIKVVEYMSRGICPIFKGSIGDFSDDPEFNQISLSYDEVDKLGYCLKGLHIQRERISQYAKKYIW
ncbi:hypothetical protein AB4158_09420 [Vibrio splendidus]